MRALLVLALGLAASQLVAQIRSPSLVDAGQPVVAWVQGAEMTQAWVARWDNDKRQWVRLGGALNEGSGLSASYISLASGPGGLIAAWTERPDHQWSGFDNVHGDLRVACWDGSQWRPLGGSLTRSENAIADLPQVREDSQGRPWIMWSEITADFNVENVYAARWDGAAWNVFDQGTLSADVSSASRARDFALDAEDRPTLAWSRMPDFHTDYQVAVGVWDGQHWVPGPSANPNPLRYAGSPSLVFDQGRPLVAMIQASRGFDVWVERWTGERWEPLGASLNAGSGGARSPRIVMTGQVPVVAWVESHNSNELRVQAWNAGRWLPYPYLDTGSADVSAFSLSVESGHAVLAWVQSGVSGKLKVARWTTDAWEDLGSPADSTASLGRGP